MTPDTFNQLSCETEGCGFITVDESEMEDHKQLHAIPEHVHDWSYKHAIGKWECKCGKTTEFFCIYCNEPIPRKEIPKEAFKKISSLVYYQGECLTDDLKKVQEGAKQ